MQEKLVTINKEQHGYVEDADGLQTVNEDIKQQGWSQMDQTYKAGQGQSQERYKMDRIGEGLCHKTTAWYKCQRMLM